MTEEISCGPYTVRTRAHVFYARLNCTARLERSASFLAHVVC